MRRTSQRANHTCYSCENRVDVYLDEALSRHNSHCFECAVANMTWEESHEYYFNKMGKLKLISYYLNAKKIAEEAAWIRFCESKGHKMLPDNVERTAEQLDEKWFPELHEVAGVGV